MNSCRSLALALALLPLALHAETIVGTNFSAINVNQTILLGEGFIPPDMSVAVGPNYIVQLVNGGYGVYDRTGANQVLMNTTSFWNNAGIGTSTTAPGMTDPRVVYDPGSGRYFASQVNFFSTGNQVLLGISNDSNPLDGWKAVQFRGSTGFADFPMLGLDQNGVYLSTNNFTFDGGSQFSNSVFSIPKADLLLPTPSIVNMSSFENLDLNTYGTSMNLALDTGGAHGSLLAIGNNFGQAVYANLSNANTHSASLSGPTLITGLSDGFTLDLRQPDGTRNVDGNDNRFSATPFIVGNYLYATNAIGSSSPSPGHDMIQWLILDLTTRLVLAQGTINDPNFDYDYPSIAANANGDFVVAYNRSGGAADPSNNISAYAEVCHFNGVSALCDNPILLKQGDVGNYQLGSDVRWGDYSAISVDPTDPNKFWTAVEYPLASNRWATEITELSVSDVPEPATLGLLTVGALLLVRRRKR